MQAQVILDPGDPPVSVFRAQQEVGVGRASLLQLALREGVQVFEVDGRWFLRRSDCVRLKECRSHDGAHSG